MSALHKSFSPSHGLQGDLRSSSNSNLNSALGGNDRSPRSFQWFGFGSQLRMPLSPVYPRQGGAQNQASSACWARKKKTREAEHNPQKSTGFGKSPTKDESPHVQQNSRTYDDEIEALEKITLSEDLSEWLDFRLYDHMPPACDAAWKETQQAWLDLAINHLITLNNGECTVHLFGIAHDNATNASALRALVEAVQPDTIAIELSPPNCKKVGALARELAPQLDKLTALVFPAGIREAHIALSPQDRCLWRKKASISSNPVVTERTHLLMIYGQVPWIEFLAAAHLASSRKNVISLEGIDLDKRYRAEKILDHPGYEQEYVDQRQQLLGPSADSFDELGINPAFYEWQENAAKMEQELPMPRACKSFLEILGILSLSLKERSRLEAIEEEAQSRMTGKAALYAQSLGNIRNLHMLGRLQQLAVGLRPRKCIVAVVGQSHVEPMHELAARTKM